MTTREVPEKREPANAPDTNALDTKAPETKVPAPPGVTAQPASQVGRMLYLQRVAGNQAVRSMLAQRTVVQGLFESEQEKVDKAASTLDVGDIKAISDYKLVKAEDRQKMIGALANQGWAGPRDEWAMEALWGLYGDKVLDAARANPGNWAMSLARGAELLKLDAVKALPGKFLSDVQGIALGHLAENEQLAKKEIAKLGGEADGQGETKPDAAARTAELQDAAKLIGEGKKAQKSLGNIVVGSQWDIRYRPDGTHGKEEVPAKFCPFQPPQFSEPTTPVVPPGARMQTFAEVQAQHDLITMIIETIKTKYPGLGAVGLGGDEDILKMGEASPEDARAMVLGSLNKLLEKIQTTRGRLNGKLLYDLKPIHTELLIGATKGGWNIDWKDPVIKSVADEFLQGHEDSEFWVELGLGSLAAAAFIVASLASGGMAAVAFGVGLGIGAGQTAASWDKAYELSAAAGSSLSRKTQLVDPAQADMAVFAAVMNTVFLFIDAAGAGGVLRGAAKVAGAAEQAAKVVALDTVEAAARPGVVVAAVDSMGPAEVIRLSGKRADDLIAIVGRESGAGMRIAEVASKDAKSLADLSAQLGRLATLEKAERVRTLGQAFDTLGPGKAVEAAGGWAKVESELGGDALLQRFKAWRDDAVTAIGKQLAERQQVEAAAADAARETAPAAGPAARPPAPLTPGQPTPAEVQAVKDLLGTRTGVPADRVLPTVAPHLENPATMLKLVQSGRTALLEPFERLATAEARAEYLVAQVNARLKEAGLPEVKAGLKSTGGRGSAVFEFKTWTVVLDKDVLADPAKAKGMFDLMLGKAYHEARHAEQWYKMARYLKGRKPGTTVDDLINNLGIPREIAEKAERSPMKVTEPDFWKTRIWYESVYGSGAARRNFVLDELGRLGKLRSEALKVYNVAKEQLEQVSKKRFASSTERNHARSVHDSALQEVHRIDKEFQPIYQEYRALPEEVDAWEAELRMVGIFNIPPIPPLPPGL